MAKQRQYHFPSLPASYLPNAWDGVLFIGIFTLFALLASSAAHMTSPYALGDVLPITLDPSALPAYSLRTVIRMFIAMFFSLVFSLITGVLAAKYRIAERIIVPGVDILQSIPILGYLSITVVGFIKLFPNSLMGPECAAILAIFTSQAWNMTLSVYQSIKQVPYDLLEAASAYRLSAWQRFWRIEMPYATPPLLWNMMMSMSAGWFFLVAAEAISVSNQHIYLPGIGSYIAVAIHQANKPAVIYAIVTMLIVILIYDQLLFRPLIQWSEKFKAEESMTPQRASSWVLSLFRRSRLFQTLGHVFSRFLDACINVPFLLRNDLPHPVKKNSTRLFPIPRLFPLLTLLALMLIGLYGLTIFILQTITYAEILHVFGLGAITALRITVMVVLSSLLWVPIGVWVGMHPRASEIVQPIAQFFAAFPANFLFPLFVWFMLQYHLNVNIWCSPLLIIGTQWYILFNVIAGASSIPNDLKDVANNVGLKHWLWWKRLILPAIFPYYVTGALTAAGGAWNASIVAEIITWGNKTLVATGLGAYVAQYTTLGDFHRIFLGIGVMSIYVVTFNVFFWQRLYTYAQTRFRSN